MANDNKTDLSDLKARLGLKKPSGGSFAPSPKAEKKPAAGGLEGLRSSLRSGSQPAPPPPAEEPDTLTLTDAIIEPEPRGGQPSRPSIPGPRGPAAPTPPAEQAKRPAPPRAAAMGPPPTQAARARPAGDGVDLNTDESVDLKSMGLTDDDVGLGLSVPVIVLMALLLVVGLFFGFMGSQTAQTRSIENARINDAQAMQRYLTPRLAAFSEAQTIIGGLDPTVVDFDATRRLAELEFSVGGDILPNNRLLVGRPVIMSLNRYMAESILLQEKIQEHQHFTNRVDRDELRALMEQREEYVGENVLAMAYDYNHLVRSFGAFREDPGSYEIPEGRLVFLRDPEPDDGGMVEIRRVDQDNPIRVEKPALILLDVGDLFRIDRRNALERYELRVRDLQNRSEAIARRAAPLEEAVTNLAERDRPSLLTFAGSTETYEEEMMEAAE